MLWFDLDNSPHVPLFRPIIKRLADEKMGYFVTAREFAQTEGLLDYWNIPHSFIGKHGGKNKVKKVLNLVQRSVQLGYAVKGKNISLAVSHGSRTQVFAAFMMGIPSVVMLDYEFTESRIFNCFSSYLYMPAIIPDNRLKEAGFNLKKVLRYNGLKEEIYLAGFRPELGFRENCGLSDDVILVAIRPPAVLGNYHDTRSERLFLACLSEFSQLPNTHILIVSRTGEDKKLIPENLLKRANITFLQGVVDGLQLIWNSDVFISGGGTMNRESALLGVPTYSIFSGRKPYVDEYLAENNRIKFLEDETSVKNVVPQKRKISQDISLKHSGLADEVHETLLALAQKH